MSQNIFSRSILEELQKQNPAEYILYMWKLEDMVRAFPSQASFDNYCKEARNTENVEEFIQILEDVYRDLNKEEEATKAGVHIARVKQLIEDLEAEHKRLSEDEKEQVYQGVYLQVLPSIVSLKAKGGGQEKGEIETCLIAVYGYHILQSQQKEIYPETLEMLKKISLLLSILGEKRADRLQKNS